MVDNWDGTYALQFALPIAGEWELSASVGLSGVPCAAAASVRAEYGPLTAEDCEIENVDGVVACGTSDPIFIQVLHPAACRMSLGVWTRMRSLHTPASYRDVALIHRMHSILSHIQKVPFFHLQERQSHNML